MRLIITLIAILLYQALSVSQQIRITVDDLAISKASLSSLSGEKISFIDSITSNGEGQFNFPMKGPNNHPGLFRLSFDKSRWIDFVNDGEDVIIRTNASAISDSMKVLASESNRLYYAFLKLNREYKTKSELLQLVLARYPHDDTYYATTRTTVAELQKSYSDFVASASTANPSSFIARYVRSAQLPIVAFDEPLDRQLAHLKAFALDHVDFRDNGLVYSDLFTSKTIEYLTYYRNPQLPKELLEKEFMVAVDTILNKAKVNQIVYKHVTGYLIDGFKTFGFEKCIDYILDNYVIKDDLCLDQGSGSSIQRMIDQKKYLPLGAVAPNIVLPDTSGNPVSLMEMTGDKVLVVFYSSSCPHCQTMIPRLSEIAKGKEGIKLGVFAISLDSSRADWLNFIRTNGLTWTNVNEPKGWVGKVAADYFIYATPTMILVNKERRIVAKPLTVEELRKFL